MCEDWITEKYIDDLRNDNKKNYAAVERVRELHKPNGAGMCMECMPDGDIRMPCPTIQALDGDR